MPISPSALPSNPRLWALIPCAGNGSRAGAAGPKQYHHVAGKPMVMHTLAAFEAVPRLAGVLVVVSAGDAFWDTAVVRSPGLHVASCGGATRAHTVANGLKALQDLGAQPHDWVLVHDAARCLITPVQIDALIDACQHDAVGGLLALPLPDTLKQAAAPDQAESAQAKRAEAQSSEATSGAEAGSGTGTGSGKGAGSGTARVACTVERADKWLAQTPQMFRLQELAAALQAAGDAVTDESSAMERAGKQPLLVRGSAQNFKVTYPEDFALAEAVLSARLTNS